MPTAPLGTRANPYTSLDQLKPLSTMQQNFQAGAQMPTAKTPVFNPPNYMQGWMPQQNVGNLPAGRSLSPSTPIVSRLPGGGGLTASGQRVPYYGPYGETSVQARTMSNQAHPMEIASALQSWSQGIGPNPGFSQMQKWLNDPNVQKQLPMSYTPPPAYSQWAFSQIGQPPQTPVVNTQIPQSQGGNYNPALATPVGGGTGGLEDLMNNPMFSYMFPQNKQPANPVPSGFAGRIYGM